MARLLLETTVIIPESKLNAANNVSAEIGVQDDANLGKGLYLRTGGEYRMRINEEGLVGIGNNMDDIPDGYRLAVDGKIICEELRVELSQNWPDYVFEEDINFYHCKN